MSFSPERSLDNVCAEPNPSNSRYLDALHKNYARHQDFPRTQPRDMVRESRGWGCDRVRALWRRILHYCRAEGWLGRTYHGKGARTCSARFIRA